MVRVSPQSVSASSLTFTGGNTVLSFVRPLAGYNALVCGGRSPSVNDYCQCVSWHLFFVCVCVRRVCQPTQRM